MACCFRRFFSSKPPRSKSDSTYPQQRHPSYNRARGGGSSTPQGREMPSVGRATHIGIAAAPRHGDRSWDAFVFFAFSGDHSRPDLRRTHGGGRGEQSGRKKTFWSNKGGRTRFVLVLSHFAFDHVPLSRRSTVPTPD